MVRDDDSWMRLSVPALTRRRRLGLSGFQRRAAGEVKLQLTEAEAGLLLAPCFAGVAQLVEHHLAKVDVESSSLFARSILGKRLRLS